MFYEFLLCLLLLGLFGTSAFLLGDFLSRAGLLAGVRKGGSLLVVKLVGVVDKCFAVSEPDSVVH